MSRPLVFVCALLALAGCDRPNESLRARELAARALRHMLAYPQSSVVRVSAGEDAAEMELSSPAPVAQVVAWYRRALPLNGWELKNERTRRDTVTLYAERRGAPVWITLRPSVGVPGTTYSLIGAISPDSTAPDSAGTR